jgi:ligand-binding sensor domain-containing protein
LFITILTSLSTILASAKTPDVEQSTLFTHFSVNEGLSHGTVVSCCQDSLGHIWFATNDGLNRYDGYEFHVYRNEENKENSINKVTEALTKELEDLFNLEQEVNIYKINIDNFGDDIVLTTGQMEALLFMID